MAKAVAADCSLLVITYSSSKFNIMKFNGSRLQDVVNETASVPG